MVTGQPEHAHKNTGVFNHVFVVARVITNTIIPYNMYCGDGGRRRAHRVTVSRELSANVVDRSAHAVRKIYEPRLDLRVIIIYNRTPRIYRRMYPMPASVHLFFFYTKCSHANVPIESI